MKQSLLYFGLVNPEELRSYLIQLITSLISSWKEDNNIINTTNNEKYSKPVSNRFSIEPNFVSILKRPTSGQVSVDSNKMIVYFYLPWCFTNEILKKRYHYINNRLILFQLNVNFYLRRNDILNGMQVNKLLFYLSEEILIEKEEIIDMFNIFFKVNPINVYFKHKPSSYENNGVNLIFVEFGSHDEVDCAVIFSYLGQLKFSGKRIRLKKAIPQETENTPYYPMVYSSQSCLPLYNIQYVQRNF